MRSIVWLSLAYASAVCSTAVGAAVEVRETADELVIRNRHIEIAIGKMPGAPLVRLVDRATGRNMVHNPKAKAIYAVTCVGADAKSVTLTAAQASRPRFELSRERESVSVRVSLQAHSESNVKVSFTVRLAADSTLAHLRLNLVNRSTWSPYEVVFPVVPAPMHLGDSVDDDAIVFPTGDGARIRAPGRRFRGTVETEHPGLASLQMVAFYDPAGGLYFASTDTRGLPKVQRFARTPDGIEFSLKHRFAEQPGGDFEMPYDVVLGVFHGRAGEPTTWYDAADVYKAWASQQSWCATTVRERKSIPDWFKAAPGFVSYQPRRRDRNTGQLLHPPQKVAAEMKCLSRRLGRPIVARPMGWEKSGSWVNPEAFPPIGGTEPFRRMAAQLKADGNRLFMYWEGYQWCFRAEETGYDGTARFEKEGAPLAVRRRNGEVLVLEHGGRTFTNMCRWLSEARDIVAESCLRCVDYGADAVQIEVVGGESHSCYARSHGHPVPTGPWQFQCLRGTFERVRSEGRKRNPDFVLTMEEPNELCIPFLDGYHARDYKVVTWPVRGIGAEGCPLFAYVYHQYHLGFAGWGDFSAWSRQYGTGQLLAYARSLVYGKMLADRWARLAPEDKPELDFLRDAANLLANAREYLLFGEMLRPMKVDTGELEVVLNVRNPRTRKVTQYLWRTPKVLHAAYRAADGSIGCVYVNIAQKPLAFSTEIHDAKLGARRCTILRGPPGSSQVVADGITLPHQINLKLAPRQILFLQVRPD